jgi:NAD(P)-dependent dehydrogenase (short-subunit alcohol dehydrogenase family)
MSSRLSGKICIITGTGGSIGREAALTFAREGAQVVGCDLTVDAAQATVDTVREAGGTMVSLHPCYLTKPADCQALVDFALRSFGRIDVLFNNGAMAYFNWIEDISDEEWDRDRREEVDLVFYLTYRHDEALVDALATDRVAYVPFFPIGGGFTPFQSSKLSSIAQRLGATTTPVALAWLLRRASNILLIAGTSSLAHLRENIGAAALELPDDAVIALDALGSSGKRLA